MGEVGGIGRNAGRPETGPATWKFNGKQLLHPLIILTLAGVIYPAAVLLNASESPLEVFIGGRMYFIILYLIFYIFIYPWVLGLYVVRGNKWVKPFDIGSNEMIGIIDEVLVESELPFRKMSREGTLPWFPFRYSEIFEIDGGRIFIGVQKLNGPASPVDIGPVGGEDEVETLGIDVLREKIDRSVEAIEEGMERSPSDP